MTATTANGALLVTEDQTIQITDKRTFSRCTFGSSQSYTIPKGLHTDEDPDYCWLNADAMVIDGRPKPQVEKVCYGSHVFLPGYGEFTVDPPRRFAGGDQPVLSPVNRETTREQENALMTLAEQGEVEARWTTCREDGMDDTDVVVEARLNRGDTFEYRDRYSRFHVMPSGRVRRVAVRGDHGREYYAD